MDRETTGDEKKRFDITVRRSFWLAALAVIIMVVLLVLTINHVREKDVVERFSGQQMNVARVMATGIEDLLNSIENNLTILSGLSAAGKVQSEDIRTIIQEWYDNLEGKIQFIAGFDEKGHILWGYPSDINGLVRENPTGYSVLGDTNLLSRSYIHGVVLSGTTGNKKEIPSMGIVAPIKDVNGGLIGEFLVIISPETIIKRYAGNASRYPSSFWLIDKSGKFVISPDSDLIGKDVELLKGDAHNGAVSLKASLLDSKEGYGQFMVSNMEGKKERTIVAHAPIHVGSDLWAIAIIAPYAPVVSSLRATITNSILGAVGLIFVIIITGVTLAQSSLQRLRSREELKRLREREDWQEKLERERKTIEGIIEGSPIPTFVVNRDHKVILWNRACAELTGFEDMDMIGTDRQYMPFYAEKRPVIADLIVDNDIEGLDKYYGRKRVGKSTLVEGAHEARDFYENLGGKRRHLYFLAAPIFDDKGEIIAAIETLQDITKEEEMAKNLKENAETLQKELDNNITLRKTIEGIIGGSPIPTFVVNRDHKVILWNRACAELTGIDAKDMIGTDRQYIPFYAEKRPVIADLIVDNDIEGLEKYYGKKRIQASDTVESAYEAQDFYVNLGGKSRHLYFLAAPIYDEKGEIIAAIETLQDVTREREMELSLKEYAETLQNELEENIRLRGEIEALYIYLQSILDSSPDKLFEICSDGTINYMSRDLRRGDHLVSPYVKGKHITEFVAPEHVDVTLAKWNDVKKGIYTPYEIEVTGKDGSKRNLLITPRPIEGTDRYVYVQRDITEFKDLENKFYESQKLAAIGQLSAGIAHEVRNPLSSIKMSLQILEKRMQPRGNDLKRFEIAEREVEHLEKLVNDVLIFAKPADPKKRPSNIEKTLQQALAMVEKSASDKSIKIQTRFEEAIPPVLVDPEMLERAFINIYHNAIEAMDDEGTLFIRAWMDNGEKPEVVVEVEDNGDGIDEADMPHLFNPFFTKKRYGTGLGMTQVKKIVDLHGGTIEIYSKKGKGTIVKVTLPAGGK